MPIQSPCAFVAAYLNHDTCELYAGPKRGQIVAYVPTRENCECTITIDVDTFVQANAIVLAMGLSPTWN